MKSKYDATSGGAISAERAAQWNDLSSSATSHLEVAGGDTTLVVVDMQQVFLSSFKDSTIPLVEAVIGQIKHAMKMGWGIVLLEAKPWRLGETIAPIMEVLDGKNGKYPRFVRRSKQTPSGAKELIEACYENGFGMGLFRVAGVYLEACVVDTAVEIIEREPASLVRLMEESCSTDVDVLKAWADVRERIRTNLAMAISSEQIDR
jgi:hypothetical protein